MAPRREWGMLAGVVVVTVALSLGVVRWMAPELLGRPADLTLVRASKEVPPFFDGVFRRADYAASELLVSDPVTVTRGRPKLGDRFAQGPHDLLGFRNRSVPAVAHVVTIGDSQTYGNGVLLEDSWPSRLEARLGERFARVYGMAIGGWGAVQYLEMATKVTAFHPRVVVVAFYSGNDALESFKVAYGSERWRDLRVDAELRAGDVPAVEFPAPPEQQWPAAFAGGVGTVFTPELRLAANQDHPAVRAGYAIMAEVARQIVTLLAPSGIQAVFTVIPTKELALAPRVARDGLAAPAAYRELVAREAENIAGLRAALEALPGAGYVDVLEALQEAALAGTALYPGTTNGHPIAAGYDAIAHAVEAAVAPYLPNLPQGLVLYRAEGGRAGPMLLRDGVAQRFATPALASANGWDLRGTLTVIPPPLVAGLEWGPSIREVDRARFGPRPAEGAAGGEPLVDSDAPGPRPADAVPP